MQLTAELFKSQAGLYVVHIPYKGTALAMPDLISGKIDVLFDSLPTGLPHVKEGRLRALGVTSAQRTSMAPGLPAIAEVLFSTPLVNPGQNYTLKFKAPANAGDYPFVCTFPGHWRLMQGTLVVTP